MSDTLIPVGQCVIVRNDRFARVLGAWQKMGQHERDWYLVTHDKLGWGGWEVVPDYAVQTTKDDLSEDSGFTVMVSELPDDLLHRTVVDLAEPAMEYGRSFAVITATSPAGDVSHTSLGTAGAGYPWWVVPITDTFRLLDWKTVDWDTYPKSLSDTGEAFHAEWARAAAASPKFPQFG